VRSTKKKRKYELGRQPANTKIGPKRIVSVRVRGGNIKYRALRLDTGNFAWATECVTRRVRILNVVYNASNNELVRTKTLVKNAIVQVDATAFRQWYEQHYGVTIGKKRDETDKGKGKGKDEKKKTKQRVAKQTKQRVEKQIKTRAKTRAKIRAKTRRRRAEGKTQRHPLTKKKKKGATKTRKRRKSRKRKTQTKKLRS